MKRLLLTVASGLLISGAMAQTATSEHTSSGEGHLYVAAWSDCMGERGYQGGTSGKEDVVTYDGTNNELVITTLSGHGAYARTATFIPLINKADITYSPTDCSNALTGVDISGLSASQQLLKVTAKVSSPVAVRITIGNGNSGYPCSNNNYAGPEMEFNMTTTLTTYTVDLSNSSILASTCGTITLSDITYVGINPDVAGGAFAGTISITKIELGDQIVTAGVNNATVDNTLINVFPNPAKDQVNVDLARLNGKSATVKVINQYGAVVKEEVTSETSYKLSVAGLEKGIYMIQVSADGKISNKKVVVQ